MKAWTHQTLYTALAKLGQESSTNQKGEPLEEPYVRLFPEKPNWAVLYRPGSLKYRTSPLHVNIKRKSWNPGVWAKIKPVLQFDESKPDTNDFFHCNVAADGWAVIAEAILAEGIPLKND